MIIDYVKICIRYITWSIVKIIFYINIFPISGSDSFWEPGNYKRTTKRIDDGDRLCKDLILLVQERANIEKEYAKTLKQWSAKWNGLIEKGDILLLHFMELHVSSFKFSSKWYFNRFKILNPVYTRLNE